MFNEIGTLYGTIKTLNLEKIKKKLFMEDESGIFEPKPICLVISR